MKERIPYKTLTENLEDFIKENWPDKIDEFEKAKKYRSEIYKKNKTI